MRVSALALVLVCSAASAQTVPFRPLAIGNQWMYAARTDSSPTATSCTLPASTTHFLRAEVVRDTTVGGAAARVLRCTQIALDGQVLGQTEAVAATLEFGRNQPVASGFASECRSLFAADPPYGNEPGAYPIDIGGMSYSMGRLAFRPENSQGSGGFVRSFQHDYGDRVGVYDYLFTYRAGTPRGCAETRLSLRSAYVDGVWYGEAVVADEPEASVPTPLRAYPVPAKTSVTVEAGTASLVEVVDALGRLVATGEAAPGRPLRLDVSGWPAGVYVARTAGGAARLVVAR